MQTYTEEDQEEATFLSAEYFAEYKCIRNTEGGGQQTLCGGFLLVAETSNKGEGEAEIYN